MIEIKTSKTADTRTCDVNTVTKEQLLQSSVQHIGDVGQALAFFSAMLTQQAVMHDVDKLTDIDGFYRDFQTKFEVQDWWRRHRQLNRHHLLQPDGTPVDVNLIDVLDFIADCVMAGMGRSGSVYELELDQGVLWRAFQNTVELLKAQVVVLPDSVCGEEYVAYGCKCERPTGHDGAHRSDIQTGSIQWPSR